MIISPFQSPFLFQRIQPGQESPIQESDTPSRGQGRQQRDIAKLQNRDREVRRHEQAHHAAAGGLVISGATFSFQRGPDGKHYAVGGEVKIDTSPVAGNPEATIQKAKQIRAAALAPANPSAQDQPVENSARTLEAQTRQELHKEEKEEFSLPGDPSQVLSHHINVFA